MWIFLKIRLEGVNPNEKNKNIFE